MVNKLWCIDFLPHLSSSLTDSLPSLNLLCHSKTDAWFMQDAPKAVWSIPYISVAFFPSLKHNFIAYCSSKVSSCPDCIFEIQQLWQSGFSRVYSNFCCSCSFEAEIIKIGQSSHKMYSNNILNYQESMTILNACPKKVWKLIEFTTYIYIYHHHHVMPLARISLTLSRHFSPSFIASGRSSRLHPVSSHSCCMYVRAGRPAFAWPHAGVHRSTLLMSSSLLLQQCPACLVCLTWIVFVMGGRWGVAARTCSILLAAFLCNCRLASSPAV